MKNSSGRPAKYFRLTKSDASDSTCFEGTVQELSDLSGVSSSRIYRLARGDGRAAVGWEIELLHKGFAPEGYTPQGKTAGPARSKKVITLYNPKTKEKMQGTAVELAEHFGVLLSSVSVFVGGHSKSLRGWILDGSSVPEHLIDDTTTYKLVNIKTGVEVNGTQKQLQKTHGITTKILRTTLSTNAGPWCEDTPEARRVIGTGLRPDGRWSEWAQFRIRHRDGAVLEGNREELKKQGMKPLTLRKILFGDIIDGHIWTVEKSPISIREARIIRASILSDKDEKITWHNLETGEEAIWTTLEFCAHQNLTRVIARNHLYGQTGHVGGWVAVHIPGKTVNKNAAIERGKVTWRLTSPKDDTVYTFKNIATGKLVKATRSDLIRLHGVDRNSLDRHMAGMRPLAEKWVAIEGSDRLHKTGDEAIAEAKDYQRNRARKPRKSPKKSAGAGPRAKARA
jgi:hypothetical protein